MKEKLENLIKKIGINEVEAILNQINSKVNVKENLKKDFIELLSGCAISFDSDDIEYRKDGILLFYYQKNKNIFRFEYNIWTNFELKYNLNYQELQDLVVSIVEEVLNYKGVTPLSGAIVGATTVEEVLNYKGVTPLACRYCIFA